MRLLHLRSSEFFGGPERAILGQCKALSGFDIFCASFVRDNLPNQFLDKCKKENIKALPILESYTGDFSVTGKLKNLLLENEIDILVTHDYKANFFGHRACASGPTVHASHYRGRTRENFKVRLYNFIDDFMLKRIKHIIAVSEASKKLLVSLRIKQERITVIPNAFNISKLTGGEIENEGEENGLVSIISAGRLSHEKGFDLLLEAFAMAGRMQRPVKLFIYGEGPEETKLKELSEKLYLTGKVEFCGFSNKLLDIYKQMSFLVLPSRSEGMPNVVLEAWSQKLGVVAASVGGVPEMIEQGKSGLLCEPENINDLASKIKYAVDNPQEMKKFGLAGFRLLFDKYNFETQAKQLSAYYKRIVEQESQTR